MLHWKQLESLNEKKLKPDFRGHSVRKDKSQLKHFEVRNLVFNSLPDQLADEVPDNLDDEVRAKYAEPAPCFVHGGPALEAAVGLARKRQKRLACKHVVSCYCQK